MLAEVVGMLMKLVTVTKCLTVLSVGPGEVFLVSGNPLVCDCTLQRTLTSLTVADMRDVTCSHPDQAGSAVSLMSASQEEFLCHYTTHCFSLCRYIISYSI